jgi:AraC-like DNA-binding protein
MPLTLEPGKVSDSVPRRVRKSHRFSLGGATLPDVQLAVVSGGRESCPAGCATRRDGSPHYSLEFVSRGRGWLTSDGKRHRLDAGTVFSFGPGFSHSITTDPRDVLEKYFVDLTGPRAPQILEECGLPPGTVAQVSSVNEVEDVFDSLIRDGSRGTGASNMLCVALSEYLMIKLADLVMPPGERPSPAAATFQRCRRYITTHFRRLRSLEQVADECGIDQAYLCRLFRRFDREGPYRFLLRLKMSYAAEQLRDPRVLVKEAAAAVGFRDPFHFSHAFKNLLGTSPDVYRRLRAQ